MFSVPCWGNLNRRFSFSIVWHQASALQGYDAFSALLACVSWYIQNGYKILWFWRYVNVEIMCNLNWKQTFPRYASVFRNYTLSSPLFSPVQVCKLLGCFPYLLSAFSLHIKVLLCLFLNTNGRGWKLRNSGQLFISEYLKEEHSQINNK